MKNKLVKNEYVEIVSLKQTGDYKLLITFNDTSQKEIDFLHFLKNSTGVFNKIIDKNEFKKHKIDMAGGITWGSGADLSSETLKYYSSKFNLQK